MKLIIDDADVAAIREIVDLYPVDGVTTNPSILAKSGRAPFEVLHEIRDIIGPDMELHAQVIARDAEGMVADARRIVSELGENTFAKVPSVPQGFKAMKALHAEGIKVTATAIYTPTTSFAPTTSRARCWPQASRTRSRCSSSRATVWAPARWALRSSRTS